jgi:hypothetical protein
MRITFYGDHFELGGGISDFYYEGIQNKIHPQIKETQRISAHKYRIVQGGEYSTPTLNMRKYRSLKKTLTLKCKYLTLYKPYTQQTPPNLIPSSSKCFY